MVGNILKRKINEFVFYVMFLTREAAFYRAPSGFSPDKTRAARFLEACAPCSKTNVSHNQLF